MGEDTVELTLLVRTPLNDVVLLEDDVSEEPDEEDELFDEPVEEDELLEEAEELPATTVSDEILLEL